MGNLVNVAGQRFNRLFIISRAENTNRGKARWLCQCDCGRLTTVVGESFRNGSTRSCGCFQKETVAQANLLRLSKDPKAHGLSKTPEYRIWIHIKGRCLNSQDQSFASYGGRGITICSEWQNSFKSFYGDMGPRPGPEYSIERRDNHWGYNPQNCYWATMLNQANNKRNNHFLTHNGKTQTVSQWARIIDVLPRSLLARLEYGWSVERALTEPFRQHCTYKNHMLSSKINSSVA